MTFANFIATMSATKAKVLTGTAVAAAALMLAAPSAHAQRFSFGVSVGTPVYAAPAYPVQYVGPGYYGGVYFHDYDAWRAHEFAEREHRFYRDDYYRREWDRDRRFDYYHDRRFDRR